MDNISENMLRTIVLEVISKIPGYYRCYELMRELKKVFEQQRGIKFEIREGSVSYCPMTLFAEACKGNCKVLSHSPVEINELVKAFKLVAKKAKGKCLEEAIDWKINVLHSWGILTEEQILIDCHSSIDLALSPGIPLFDEFPIFRKIAFENLVRTVPFGGLEPTNNLSIYNLGDDIYAEIAFQKGNEIIYQETDYRIELQDT